MTTHDGKGSHATGLEPGASLIERTLGALPDLVAVKDKDLRFLYVNRAFCEFYGKSPAELIGAVESSAVDSPQLEQERHVLSTGTFVDVPRTSLRRHDGIDLPFHVQRTALRDERGKIAGVIASARAVRDDAGAAIDPSSGGEHHNRAMLSVIPDMYFRLRRDGTYVEFSAGRGLDTALPPSLFLGKRVQDVTPDIAPMVTECIDEALRTGDLASREFQMFAQGRLTDYEARVLASGPEDVLFIVRDISKQKQTELRLREADARFRAFAGQSLFGIFIVQDGQLVFANRKLADIVGCTEEELIREGLMPWVADADRALLRGFLEDLEGPEGTGLSGLSRTFEGLRRDGTSIYLDTYGAVVTMEGKPAVIGVMVDVTANRRAAEDQRRLQEEVLRIQESLVAELSTPLIPISDTVLVMPLIGTIDDRRSKQLMSKMLDGVANSQAEVVILDVTGVSSVTTETAAALIRCAQASRLLGVDVLLTGLRSEVAQTLVAMGVEMTGLETLSTLKAGIAYALRRRRG